MIGILASMRSELAFTDLCKLVQSEKHGCFTFETYQYDSILLVCAVCGTGKVSAAVCTQLMIEYYHPRLIVNIGTAGSLTNEVHSKDIVVAVDSIQHDFDISPFGWQKGELPELKIIDIKCDEKFVACAKKIYTEGHTVHFGRILSGDMVVTDREVKNRLTSLFGGLCAEMEGAAVGQVCCMNQIPYGIIRGISDGDDENQHKEFLSNIESVAEINGKFLLGVLKKYTK